LCGNTKELLRRKQYLDLPRRYPDRIGFPPKDIDLRTGDGVIAKYDQVDHAKNN